MNPLVSILIPAYNSEKWITQTLESALAQTWQNKEIIVVNDGSKDNTLAVARTFESRGVKVFDQPNQGAAATRNNAFSLSKGDFIQWLDADDLLSVDKIESQIEILQSAKDPLLLVSCPWAYFHHRPELAKFEPNLLWDDLTPAEWLVRKLAHNLHMQTAVWLVSRALTSQAGSWNPKLWVDDDGEYFARVLTQSSGVRFCKSAKVFYRRAGLGSVSDIGDSRRKLEAQLVSMKLHIQYLLSLKDDQVARAACAQYLQNWLYHFYPEQDDLVAELKAMAHGLNGVLAEPSLSWKYSWICRLFGWKAAKRARRLLPQIRFLANSLSERTLLHS